MGRKGGGGGTAGGGKRGNVTFNRVVPKFLQNIRAKKAKDSEDARLAREEDRKREALEREQNPKTVEQEPAEEIIASLERDGFNVIQLPSETHSKTGEEQDPSEDKKTTSKPAAENRLRSSSAKEGIAHGGIKKKVARVARPTKKFNINNKNRLSFAASDSDSDESD